MLCPSRFAEVVVPYGTTTVITDAHEIANVLGTKGIDYMRKDAAGCPLKLLFAAPSCVPATPFETSGAVIGLKELKDIFKKEDVVALGEVMNFPAVIAGEKEILDKIQLAHSHNKPVDGHAPMLRGKKLCRYIAAGISTDHESVTADEALEKAQKGMKIMMRFGSASKSMDSLIKVAKSDWMIVSDDTSIHDLLQGHLNNALKIAIQRGWDPIAAIKAVTINPAKQYKLDNGAIKIGKSADMVEVSNLKDFEVKRVFIDGRIVAENGKPLFQTQPFKAGYVEKSFRVSPKKPDDFKIICQARGFAKVRVIEIIEGQIITRESEHNLKVVNNEILPDLSKDVIKIAVVERYGQNRIANGFVKGISLKKGALALSIAHDSHNIISIGTNKEDMAKAVNRVIRYKGGLSVVADNKVTGLDLPVAGLMSTKPAQWVRDKYDIATRKLNAIGCGLTNPFMTISFLALPVIPDLKLSDKGLFDVKKFRFVDVIKSDI
jgi:adenine deaminase